MFKSTLNHRGSEADKKNEWLAWPQQVLIGMALAPFLITLGHTLFNIVWGPATILQFLRPYTYPHLTTGEGINPTYLSSLITLAFPFVALPIFTWRVNRQKTSMGRYWQMAWLTWVLSPPILFHLYGLIWWNGTCGILPAPCSFQEYATGGPLWGNGLMYSVAINSVFYFLVISLIGYGLYKGIGLLIHNLEMNFQAS